LCLGRSLLKRLELVYLEVDTIPVVHDLSSTFCFPTTMDKSLLNEHGKDSQSSQTLHPSSWRTGF
jgi:hypothetical protein